jgi:hypothetical protein
MSHAGQAQLLLFLTSVNHVTYLDWFLSILPNMREWAVPMGYRQCGGLSVNRIQP